VDAREAERLRDFIRVALKQLPKGSLAAATLEEGLARASLRATPPANDPKTTP
jgi:hypothetical protein